MGAFLNPHWLAPATLEGCKRWTAGGQCDLTLAQFALAVGSATAERRFGDCGASRPEQVNDNAAASGAHVDRSLFTQAERLLPSH